MARLIPRGDRVLVKLVDFDLDEKPVHIEVAGVSEEAPDKGEVVAVGAKVSDETAEGQVVLFGRYSGTPAGDEYHLIREDDILAEVVDVEVKPYKPDPFDHPLRQGRADDPAIQTVTPQMISPRVK